MTQNQSDPRIKIILVPGSSLPTQPWWNSLHSTIITAFQHKDISAYPPTWTRLLADPAAGAKGLAGELGADGQLAVALLVNDDGSEEQKEVEEAIACGGVVPFRGLTWIQDVPSVTSTSTSTSASGTEVKPGEITLSDGPPPAAVTTKTGDENDLQKTVPTVNQNETKKDQSEWELCCVCVHPTHRRGGVCRQILSTLYDWVKTQGGGRRMYSNYVIEESERFWTKQGYVAIEGAGGMLKKGFKVDPEKEGLREDLHFAMAVRELE